MPSSRWPYRDPTILWQKKWKLRRRKDETRAEPWQEMVTRRQVGLSDGVWGILDGWVRRPNTATSGCGQPRKRMISFTRVHGQHCTVPISTVEISTAG